MKEMYCNIIFRVFLLLVINYHNLVCSGMHWIHDLRSLKEPNFDENIYEIINETDYSQEVLENNTISTPDNAILFWTTPEEDSTETNLNFQMNEPVESENVSYAFQDAETKWKQTQDKYPVNPNISKPIEINHNTSSDILYNDLLDYTMNEKIVLQRNNCHLEIDVRESHDIKIGIEFGKLENNTSGKCCITLIGPKNSMLGVLISNVHLYQNNTQEILKVISAVHGPDFVLKEIYPWTKSTPLLLTETHKVYVVLYYKATNVSPHVQDSHFNLEVFTYRRASNCCLAFRCKEVRKVMSNNSSSSEDEFERLKEATDSYFLREDLYATDKFQKSKDSPKPAPTFQNHHQNIPSNNPFSVKVTPEFQKYVSKHLSKLLDKFIDDSEIIQSNKKFKTKKNVKSGVKLFSSSKKYLMSVSNTKPDVQIRKIRRKENLKESDYIERAKEVAVSPQWILSQKETRHWAPYTKGEIEIVKWLDIKKEKKKLP